ncbi:hypothetical protein LPUS_01788 [Lasallia pustulata]|uniref:Uncharacterized protein n=1 Tax=Lasallia pustulata TaxID=136370 RepID=A0A1W5CR46_9LECA|nr:hypothetical protein LPUS_01788 [Lasallia pustulata]
MSQQQKIRRIIMTVSVAAITATGAWYGAGLKTKQEIKREIKARREATPMAKIAQLEEARSGLVAKRLGLERKIAELEARQAGMTKSEAATGRERR